MTINWKQIGIIVLVIIATLIFVKQCEEEPQIRVRTKEVVTYKTDTITQTRIIEKPLIKYVIRHQTVKGKDSIVYVQKDDAKAIKVSEYKSELATDSAKANLKITTTGELLKVDGTITYPRVEKTITKEIIKPKSGLFLSLESSFSPMFEQSAIHLDYQYRNVVLIGGSINYNNQIKKVYPALKVGFKIF
jgi:uncharacterized protein YpmB